jgi:hypothetical protein
MRPVARISVCVNVKATFSVGGGGGPGGGGGRSDKVAFTLTQTDMRATGRIQGKRQNYKRFFTHICYTIACEALCQQLNPAGVCVQ